MAIIPDAPKFPGWVSIRLSPTRAGTRPKFLVGLWMLLGSGIFILVLFGPGIREDRFTRAWAAVGAIMLLGGIWDWMALIWIDRNNAWSYVPQLRQAKSIWVMRVLFMILAAGCLMAAWFIPNVWQ